jgi:hypothetical protein
MCNRPVRLVHRCSTSRRGRLLLRVQRFPQGSSCPRPLHTALCPLPDTRAFRWLDAIRRRRPKKASKEQPRCPARRRTIPANPCMPALQAIRASLTGHALTKEAGRTRNALPICRLGRAVFARLGHASLRHKIEPDAVLAHLSIAPSAHQVRMAIYKA